MNKRLALILTIFSLLILVCASGCNDSDAETASACATSTVAADDCAGCPHAATCADAGQTAQTTQTAACTGENCDPAKCQAEGKTCDPAACHGEHPAGCAGDGDCTAADCANCPNAAKCDGAKSAQTEQAGCPSQKTGCGGCKGH